MKNKQEKGITLIALVVTIVVLMILAGISLHTGHEVIQKARDENFRTNLLLIRAKAIETVEEVNFKGSKEIENTEITITINKENTTTVTLDNVADEWGLSEVEDKDKYKIVFSSDGTKLTGVNVTYEDGEEKYKIENNELYEYDNSINDWVLKK